MANEISFFEKLSIKIRNSITLKLFTITLLMLLLMIPSSMITSIITEREGLNKHAVEEVSSKWAADQLITGPILTIPLEYEYEEKDEKIRSIKYLYILPEALTIQGELSPTKLHRGIYEVVVYSSSLHFSGSFDLDKKFDQRNFKKMRFDQAFLTLGISDLRGIEDEIIFQWDNQALEVTPGSSIRGVINSGITIHLPDIESSFDQLMDFKFAINLQGSQNLSFVPVGNITNVTLESAWPQPSFDGDFLPDERQVGDNGFLANWKVLQLNRNFPQSWIGGEPAQELTATFGVNLILPLDNYQKAMRSAKYAAMTISLTFLIFFLVEILHKRKIHPFQYILVGLGLCLFYILLVSITEHSNFNFAYIISAGAIVGMISLYSLSIFQAQRLTIILFISLLCLFSFLFVIIQLTDYALLIGGVGLTLILAMTMYFTRHINWYRLPKDLET